MTDKVVILLTNYSIQPVAVASTLNTVQESLEEDKESLSFHDKLDFKFIKNAYDDSPPKVNLNTLKNSNASTSKSSDASLKSS